MTFGERRLRRNKFSYSAPSRLDILNVYMFIMHICMKWPVDVLVGKLHVIRIVTCNLPYEYTVLVQLYLVLFIWASTRRLPVASYTPRNVTTCMHVLDLIRHVGHMGELFV